jgi:hypothetical protein
MTVRTEWMDANKAGAYRTRPGAHEKPLEPGEIAVALTTGRGFTLILTGTPKRIAELAELIFQIAGHSSIDLAERLSK